MDLTDYRDKINAIDQQLLELFTQRMDVAAKIGEYKASHGLPVLNPAREREVLQRVSDAVGPQFKTYARQLYTTLFDLSRSYQSQLMPVTSELPKAIENALANTAKIFPTDGTIACQGVEGAYSQLAAQHLFPMGNISFFKTWDGVFNAVEKGLCKFGMLPIENSTHGTVNTVYDLMRDHNFYIVRSIKLQINHALLALPGVKQKDIREVVSHEQALGQCSAFLKSLPGIKITKCDNTATAAQIVAQSGRKDIAAICSGACAELYGLRCLNSNIQNSDYNYTRFICIAKDLEIHPGANRISLLISVPHRPGALGQLMAKFSSLGVNLLKLESRPVPGRDFEFLFYFDFEASVYDSNITNLLGQLANDYEQFTLLGCYLEN